MSNHRVPPGAPPVLRVREAAAVLGDLDPRTLMRWCRGGDLVRGAFQARAGGSFWIPSAEVARLAGVLMVAPDWERVI